MLDGLPCHRSDTQVHCLTQGHWEVAHLYFNVLKPFSHSARTPLLETGSHTRTPLSGNVLTVREHFAQEPFSQCEFIHSQCENSQCEITYLRSLNTQWHLYQAATSVLALLLLCCGGHGAALRMLPSHCPLDNLPGLQQWSTTLPPHFLESLDRFEYPL